MLTEAIIAPVAAPIVLETVLLFVVVAICCCCFGGGGGGGGVAAALAAVVGFVVVIICWAVVDDDSGDEVGCDADNVDGGGFTVFAIPHILDSVVLTTLRLGLLGSHIFALSSGDIVVVLLLLSPAARDDSREDVDGLEDGCCAYT